MTVRTCDDFYSIMAVLAREMLEFGLMEPNHLVQVKQLLKRPKTFFLKIIISLFLFLDDREHGIISSGRPEWTSGQVPVRRHFDCLKATEAEDLSDLTTRRQCFIFSLSRVTNFLLGRFSEEHSAPALFLKTPTRQKVIEKPSCGNWECKRRKIQYLVYLMGWVTTERHINTS